MSNFCLKKSKFFKNLPIKIEIFLVKLTEKKIKISGRLAWTNRILLTRFHDPSRVQTRLTLLEASEMDIIQWKRSHGFESRVMVSSLKPGSQGWDHLHGPHISVIAAHKMSSIIILRAPAITLPDHRAVSNAWCGRLQWEGGGVSNMRTKVDNANGVRVSENRYFRRRSLWTTPISEDFKSDK